MDSLCTSPGEFTARVICPRCRRPGVVCYCKHLPSIETRTRIVVLQHPRERDMPIGTAHMATLCLPSSQLHVGVEFEDAKLASMVDDSDGQAILLYPGHDACDLATRVEDVATLFVIDGTWSQAKKLIAKNPRLRALPRYALRPRNASEYRIRREPDASYVSTIEAIMYALEQLEGQPERFRALLDPFRAMVDAQIEQRSLRRSPRRLRFRGKPPGRPTPALLRKLADRAQDVVCVYGEANAWPYGSRERALHRQEIVHWVAVRLHSGDVFERFARPTSPLAETTPSRIGIPRETVTRAGPLETVVDDWKEFVRNGDLVVSWGTYATRLFFQSSAVQAPEQLDLRLLARAVERRKIGTLEDYLESIGRAGGPPILTEGRAGKRLGQVMQATRFMIEKAQPSG